MIRKFRPEDKEKYIEYSKLMYASKAVSHNIDPKHFERTFEACINNSPYTVGVMVEYDGKVVGYGLLSISYSNEAGGLQMWLEELYIEEEYRSHGLGKEFFEFAESYNPDIKRYRLEVVAGNRAKHLYDRLGYKEIDYVQMCKDIED